MSGPWNDFNSAQSNTNVIPKGTLAKVRLTLRPGGFDDPSQGWTGGWARRAATGAVYLDAEYTVLEGPYARRKVWSLIGLYSPKGPDWANMGRGLIRGILNSARGVSDKDCRIAHHPDPLAALLMALTGRKIPLPAPAAKPVRRRAADPQPAAPVAAQSGILDDL